MKKVSELSGSNSVGVSSSASCPNSLSPRRVMRSTTPGVFGFAAGDGLLRSRRAPVPVDCRPSARRERAIYSAGYRRNPRGEANSDPLPKLARDSDEHSIGRWNNYARSLSAVGREIVPQTQHFFDFAHGQSLLGHSVSPLAQRRTPHRLSSAAFCSNSDSSIQKRQYQPRFHPASFIASSDYSHPRNLYSHARNTP